MPFWSKHKASSNENANSAVKPVINDPLVAKLVSDVEADFTSGLLQVIEKAEAGDSAGVEAMREAIRLRSGKKEVTFYQPGLRISNYNEFTKRNQNAPKEILDLAKRKALLEDPYHSGDLITAVMSGFEADFMRNLVIEIFKVSGTHEAYNFQLLYNEIRSNTKLNYS